MAPDGSAEANDALVREFMAAWERRDTAFILDCFAEDAVYHSMPLTPIEGKDAVAAWVKGFEEYRPGDWRSATRWRRVTW